MPAIWYPHGVGITDDEIKSHGEPRMVQAGAPFHPRMLEGARLSVPCEVDNGTVYRVRTPTPSMAQSPDTAFASSAARPVRTIVLSSAR